MSPCIYTLFTSNIGTPELFTLRLSDNVSKTIEWMANSLDPD